jgi:hypothetical protein
MARINGGVEVLRNARALKPLSKSPLLFQPAHTPLTRPSGIRNKRE